MEAIPYTLNLSILSQNCWNNKLFLLKVEQSDVIICNGSKY